MALKQYLIGIRRRVEQLALYFTPSERTVIVFLILSLLAGGIVSLVRQHRPTCSSELGLIPGPLTSADSTSGFAEREPNKGVDRPTLDEVAKKSDELASGSRRGLPAITRKVNINKASKRVLMTLPGVGPVIADRIIKYRQEKGAFKGIEGIRQVKGIGPKTYEKMKERLVIK